MLECMLLRLDITDLGTVSKKIFIYVSFLGK